MKCSFLFFSYLFFYFLYLFFYFLYLFVPFIFFSLSDFCVVLFLLSFLNSTFGVAPTLAWHDIYSSKGAPAGKVLLEGRVEAKKGLVGKPPMMGGEVGRNHSRCVCVLSLIWLRLVSHCLRSVLLLAVRGTATPERAVILQRFVLPRTYYLVVLRYRVVTFGATPFDGSGCLDRIRLLCCIVSCSRHARNAVLACSHEQPFSTPKREGSLACKKAITPRYRRKRLFTHLFMQDRLPTQKKKRLAK